MMKLLKKLWGAGLLAILLISAVPQQSAAQDDYISEQEFYDELDPYGTWVYDPQYGNIWVPDVEEDFRPYASRGHWVLTEYGNTWVSDYPWGWATFHYGRWRFDDYYGWVWIPGYEWAPAWVSWRHGGGYYGWAPLMPGISVSLSFGSGYNVPDTYWAFAPERYINQPNIYNYYVPRTRVVTIINRTTIINNTYVRDNRRYIAGPRIADIQRVTRQEPQVYAINNARRPGTINVQNNTVNIFRPSVRKAPDARPSRAIDGAAYRQQNPNQSIARRGPGGDASYNRENAARLKEVVRNPGANNNVVRVNDRRGDNPGQPNIAQPQNNRRNVRDNTRQQPNDMRTMPENTPNVAPSRMRGNNLDEQAQKEQQARQQQAEQQKQRNQVRPAQDETQEEAWQRRRTDARMTQATQDGFRRQQRANEQQVINEQAQKKREERAQQQAQQQQQRRQNDQQKQQADQQQREQQRQQQQVQRDEQRKQQDAQREQQRQQQAQQQQAQREQQRQQQAQQQQTQRDQQRQQQVQPPPAQQQNQQQRGGEQRQQRRPPQ